MLAICNQCGIENRAEKLFCEQCASNLGLATSFDLTVKDFVTDGDQEAFEMLEETGPLLHLLHSTVVKPKLKKVVDRLLRNTKSSKSNETIGLLAEECADILGLNSLPDVRVGDIGQKNAFTTESDSKAIIIIDQSLIHYLSDNELSSLLGHEMGHIKSRHLMYHSIAELLERGIEFSTSLTGIRLLSIPLRLALMSWHRESELSADRASLIVTDDLGSIASMFAKIVGGYREIMDSDTILNSLLEVFNTHPVHLNRIKALREFANSPEYAKVRKKIRRKKMLKKAFDKTCRFCGASKLIEEIFCPGCGRSLA